MLHIKTRDQVLEGVSFDPEGRAVLSRVDSPNDLLRFVDGKVKVLSAGNYRVMYRLESNPEAKDKAAVKWAMDQLKAAKPEGFLNIETALHSFMKQDLLDLARGAKSSGTIDYIIKVGSSEGLAEAMTQSAKRVFPKAQIVEIPKIIHRDLSTAVDFDGLITSMKNHKDSSFKLVKSFVMSKIDKESTDPELYEIIRRAENPTEMSIAISSGVEWRPEYKNFKVRKTNTVPGNIIRYFNKYDLNSQPFVNAIVKCVREQKNAILFDDNIHNRTDIRTIFKAIDAIASSEIKNVKTLEGIGVADRGTASKLETGMHSRFTGYVLYRIKDEDLR